jgi:hypothetical protein
MFGENGSIWNFSMSLSFSAVGCHITHSCVRTYCFTFEVAKGKLPENLKCDEHILQGFPSIDSAMFLRISIQLTLHHYDAYYRYPLGAHFQLIVRLPRLVNKVLVSQ